MKRFFLYLSLVAVLSSMVIQAFPLQVAAETTTQDINSTAVSKAAVYAAYIGITHETCFKDIHQFGVGQDDIINYDVAANAKYDPAKLLSNHDLTLIGNAIDYSTGVKQGGVVNCDLAMANALNYLGFGSSGGVYDIGNFLIKWGWKNDDANNRYIWGGGDKLQKYTALWASRDNFSSTFTTEIKYGTYYSAIFGANACAATGGVDYDNTSQDQRTQIAAKKASLVTIIAKTDGTTKQAVYPLSDKSVYYDLVNTWNPSYEGRGKCNDEALSAYNDAAKAYAKVLADAAAAAKKAAIMQPIVTYCKTLPDIAYEGCLDSTYKAQQTCWQQVRVEINGKDTGELRDRTAQEKVDCMAAALGADKSAMNTLVKGIEAALATQTVGDVTDPADNTPAATKASCTGGVLGWILCPFMKILETANEFMAPQVEGQLLIDPLVEGNAIYSGTYPIWQIMVGVANLFLIIAFLVVIFSQATSIGLSAYGIKKMLPRIIAAAILINLSYFICAVAIDIVNVVGGAVQSIINVGASAIKVSGGFDFNFGKILLELGGAALGVGAVALTGAVAYLVPLGLTAILATMTIFLGLALRKIVIVLLIVIAPIAFAAMILPGTEGLFKKWYKALGGLLIMYPVVMAILYGSVLVSNIILSQDSAAQNVLTASGTTTVDITKDSLLTIVIAYAIVAIGPLAGTYMFIKSSNKLGSMAAGAITKMGSPFKRLADGFAKDKGERSIAGTYMADRKRTEDAWAKIRNRQRLSKFGQAGTKYEKGPFKDKDTLSSRMGMGRLITAGMDERTAKSFRAGLAGEENAVYRQEVEQFKQELGNKYTTKEAALPHYWDRLRSGDASAAEVHALHSHIESLPGGATVLDKIWTGEEVDTTTGKNVGHYMAASIAGSGEEWTGAQRSLLARDSKFYGGSADVSYQLLNRGEDYVAALRDGKQEQFLGVNSDVYVGKTKERRTATYTKLDGTPVVGATVIIMPGDTDPLDTEPDPEKKRKLIGDPNGGMTYIGERSKNALGLGSRAAYALELSERLTDEAADNIAKSQITTEAEHVVGEVAKRRLADIEREGKPINPARNKNAPTTPEDQDALPGI